MINGSQRLRRSAASLGIAALIAIASLGAGSAALADVTPSPSNIQGSTGTLVIHKHAGDPGAPGDGTQITDPAKITTLGQALSGVQFTVQRVSYAGTPIDLTSSSGWDQSQNATPASVVAAPYSVGAGVTASTDSGGQAAIPDLPFGLYLVTETSPGVNPIVSPVQPFLVSVPYPDEGTWLYTVHVYPKNKLNDTTPTKSVAAPDAPVLGSRIVWTVNAPIPPLSAGDTYRSFSVTDTLDPRLSYVGVVVKLDGATLTPAADYIVSGATTITFTSAGLAKLAGKTAVSAELTTTVSSLGADGIIPNTAVVTTNGSARTTNTPQTKWGPLAVVKRDAATQNTLAGAVFEIYDAKNGTKVAGPFTTDSGGRFDIDGLWVGNDAAASKDYWVKETRAPAGYVLPADPWTKATVVAQGTASPATLSISNTQQIGPNLPLTGGAGSILFVVLGSALALAGVGAIVVRRVLASRP